jgi:hypothetical protein
MMRVIILHLHLFKNAGTSVDRILQRNFPARWVGREFQGVVGSTTNALRQWIEEEPQACAFSSHTFRGPLPSAPNLTVVPITLLRDPVDRIVSAYRFERRQEAETRGARLAKSETLEGYVRARLATPGDRQCSNFQTMRLASLVPGPQPELTRAVAALKLLQRSGVVGQVEEFDPALRRLTRKVRSAFPTFTVWPIRSNVSSQDVPRLTAETRALLERENKDDFALVQMLRRIDAAA